MKKLMLLIAAFTMVASFALTAAAAEWNFYGSARMATYTEDDNNIFPADDDRDTKWDIQGNSRFGASVKVSDTLVGGFEYGTGVNLRKLYAEWTFGSGKLLVGQTYTPASSMFYSNQVWGSDNDLLDCGQQYVGRVPMIQLTFGDFKLAFVRPNTGSLSAFNDVDTTLPKIEASYGLKMDNFFVDLSGGYQAMDADEVDIDAYLIALGGGMDFGAAYVKANIYYAQNGEAYGLYNDDTQAANGSVVINGELEDVDTFGYLVVAGFKVSDMLTIEGGYGALEHDSDFYPSADDAANYYLNASITLAPGVFVVPEVGVRDYKDNQLGQDAGDMTYIGAKWQMNF